MSSRRPNVNAVNPLIKSWTKSGTHMGTIIEQIMREEEIIFIQT